MVGQHRWASSCLTTHPHCPCAGVIAQKQWAGTHLRSSRPHSVSSRSVARGASREVPRPASRLSCATPAQASWTCRRSCKPAGSSGCTGAEASILLAAVSWQSMQLSEGEPAVTGEQLQCRGTARLCAWLQAACICCKEGTCSRSRVCKLAHKVDLGGHTAGTVLSTQKDTPDRPLPAGAAARSAGCAGGGWPHRTWPRSAACAPAHKQQRQALQERIWPDSPAAVWLEWAAVNAQAVLT